MKLWKGRLEKVEVGLLQKTAASVLFCTADNLLSEVYVKRYFFPLAMAIFCSLKFSCIQYCRWKDKLHCGYQSPESVVVASDMWIGGVVLCMHACDATGVVRGSGGGLAINDDSLATGTQGASGAKTIN
jgi:hypothetical protein